MLTYSLFKKKKKFFKVVKDIMAAVSQPCLGVSDLL